MPLGQQVEGRATSSGLDSPVRTKVPISHHDTIKWFEAIPGTDVCFFVSAFPTHTLTMMAKDGLGSQAHYPTVLIEALSS